MSEWVTGCWEKRKSACGGFVVTLKGGRPLICRVNDNEDWANLIAVSPEMYEVIDALVNSKDYCTEEFKIALQKGREVLAKARG